MKPGSRPVALALILGGLFGLTGVAAGAFGAHGLKQSVSASDLEIWKTGAHYQQLHAAVLIGVAGAARYLGPSQVRVIVSLLTLGIVVFAGALYTLALGGPRWLGAVAPVGGLSLMAGWAMIVVGALRSRPVD